MDQAANMKKIFKIGSLYVCYKTVSDLNSSYPLYTTDLSETVDVKLHDLALAIGVCCDKHGEEIMLLLTNRGVVAELMFYEQYFLEHFNEC